VSRYITNEIHNDQVDLYGPGYLGEGHNKSEDYGTNFTVFKLPCSKIENRYSFSKIGTDENWYTYSTGYAMFFFGTYLY
jgi:hypothetical protein